MSFFSRRNFLKASGMAAGGAMVTGPKSVWPDEQTMAQAEQNTDSFSLLRREQERRRDELPEAADFHRLPLSWHKEKARELKSQARKRGIDGGIFLTRQWNIMYATGLFYSDTERPFACFLPMDEEDGLIWMFPYLDEELVTDWWSTDTYSYFDHHHAEGGFPNEGDVEQGSTVNIYRWWGETLAELGYGNTTIGVDSGGLAEIGIMPGQLEANRLNMTESMQTPQADRPSGGSFGEMAEALTGAQFVDVADLMIRNRIVKDEMENALTQRAMDYWSEIHAFARNYMLERGLSVVDREIANAATMWGLHRIMEDIPHESEPHNAVGISVSIGCRTGRKTAYPHPNQISWARVERGHALQIAGVVRIGGYGGEQYRSFLFHPWTDEQEHIWDVHTRSYEIQAEESYVGNTCTNVARAVHEHQVQNDCADYIYHRPGHGEGMEGHQPPYQALGDYTEMERGMHFSNEPGLYNAKDGFGFNHSNNILVAQDRGLQMGTAPVTKEWCFLRL